METNDAIKAAADRLNAAQSAHAACLEWRGGKFISKVSDAELSAACIASLEAERDYCAAFGDTESAQQIGYQIEDEKKR